MDMKAYIKYLVFKIIGPITSSDVVFIDISLLNDIKKETLIIN